MPPRSPFRVDPLEYPPEDDDVFAAPTRYALEHPEDCDENAPCDIRELHVPPPPPERPGMKGPVNLANVPASNVDWLWPGRIPLGKLTLLVGDPGAGKSLVALDVAARVTNGAPWPGDNPVPPPELAPRNSQLAPSSVLLLSAEDDLADTIRPRLEAAGADLTRIVAIPPNWSAEDPKGHYDADTGLNFQDWRPAADRPAPPRRFDLRHDLHAINNLLMRMRPCRLIIIDPISAYLGKNVDNFNSEVRRLLAPLAALAARRNLAVIAISHLRKQAGSALHRAIGSLAFTAAARAAWLVAQDPSDADRRLLLPVKNNLAATVGALSFTIAQNPLPSECREGEAPAEPGSASNDTTAPVIHWSPDVLPLTADEALRPPKFEPPPKASPERDDANRWLQSALAAGVQPSRRIERHAAAHGIRLITLRRAFRELGGEAIRAGFGPLGQWYWRLPGIGPQEPNPDPDQLFDD